MHTIYPDQEVTGFFTTGNGGFQGFLLNFNLWQPYGGPAHSAAADQCAYQLMRVTAGYGSGPDYYGTCPAPPSGTVNSPRPTNIGGGGLTPGVGLWWWQPGFGAWEANGNAAIGWSWIGDVGFNGGGGVPDTSWINPVRTGATVHSISVQITATAGGPDSMHVYLWDAQATSGWLRSSPSSPPGASDLYLTTIPEPGTYTFDVPWSEAAPRADNGGHIYILYLPDYLVSNATTDQAAPWSYSASTLSSLSAYYNYTQHWQAYAPDNYPGPGGVSVILGNDAPGQTTGGSGTALQVITVNETSIVERLTIRSPEDTPGIHPYGDYQLSSLQLYDVPSSLAMLTWYGIPGGITKLRLSPAGTTVLGHHGDGDSETPAWQISRAKLEPTGLVRCTSTYWTGRVHARDPDTLADVSGETTLPLGDWEAVNFGWGADLLNFDPWDFTTAADVYAFSDGTTYSQVGTLPAGTPSDLGDGTDQRTFYVWDDQPFGCCVFYVWFDGGYNTRGVVRAFDKNYNWIPGEVTFTDNNDRAGTIISGAGCPVLVYSTVYEYDTHASPPIIRGAQLHMSPLSIEGGTLHTTGDYLVSDGTDSLWQLNPGQTDQYDYGVPNLWTGKGGGWAHFAGAWGVVNYPTNTHMAGGEIRTAGFGASSTGGSVKVYDGTGVQMFKTPRLASICGLGIKRYGWGSPIG